MKILLTTGVLAVMVQGAVAETVAFDKDQTGAAPQGWLVAVTGSGKAKWAVEEDASARSKGKVVKQSGQATYALLLKEDARIKDGFVEVKFKPISGKEDRAGGIVWRARDANNYYVVRANALEDNVVAYKTVNGKRQSIDIVGRRGGYGLKAAVAANEWHTLRVDFAGTRFRISYEGKPLFEVEDKTFTEAGMIGLWTKADSVTAFDRVEYGETR
jgi:hypothetical protein